MICNFQRSMATQENKNLICNQLKYLSKNKKYEFILN